MAWAQFDDGAWTDSSMAALSDRAHRLYVNCWIYCADKTTDGHLTLVEVTRVAAMFGLTDPASIKNYLEELVTAKLAKVDVLGYSMVGWLDANRSRKQVDHDRKVNREKQRRWREGQAKK